MPNHILFLRELNSILIKNALFVMKFLFNLSSELLFLDYLFFTVFDNLGMNGLKIIELLLLELEHILIIDDIFFVFLLHFLIFLHHD